MESMDGYPYKVLNKQIIILDREVKESAHILKNTTFAGLNEKLFSLQNDFKLVQKERMMY